MGLDASHRVSPVIVCCNLETAPISCCNFICAYLFLAAQVVNVICLLFLVGVIKINVGSQFAG